MKILNITTKTGSAILDPSTGKPAHYIVAGPVTEIGYMPGGLALYVRRVGDDMAQVVPMGSVSKYTVDMPALGKEVTIAPGSAAADAVRFDTGVSGPPEAFGLPSGGALEGEAEVTSVDRETGTVTYASRTVEARRVDPVLVPAVTVAPGASVSEQIADAPGPKLSRREKRRRR